MTPTIKIFRIWDPFFTGAGAPPPARTYAERLARARRRRFFTGRYSSRCSPVLPVPPILAVCLMLCRRRHPPFDVTLAQILVVLFARVFDQLALLSRQDAFVLPRPRVDDRVVDGDGIRDVVRVDTAERLRQMQLIAVRMADRVEPR